MAWDHIFQPLHFPSLTVKNRVFRSNISGRFDNYDGSGNPARINWETKFARGGVGAIISSFVPVQLRGRIVPNYAMIDHDRHIPFWRAVGDAVHAHDCRFILQLSHAGRQRDIPGIEFEKAVSSTDDDDPIHGFECERLTKAGIAEIVQGFADGARRARRAGLDGVELHGANGYLITQFLSSAINDRDDEYGGTLRNRARFVLEIVKAIRAEVGTDFHLQVKISAVDHNADVARKETKGNTLDESVQVCRWLAEAGVDAIHVSTGSFFPHPKNPAGVDLPVEDLVKTYDTMLSSGARTFLNYLFFRAANGALARRRWQGAAPKKDEIEGQLLSEAETIRRAVAPVPVICTGGFQTASVVDEAIAGGRCDAVSIARSLVANNDLVQQWERGADRPAIPCTYCNKCLVNVIENPLGCYDVTRFAQHGEGAHRAMVAEIMSVFQPEPFR
jgi:2,4-dienoyl-CoA reductase-like NADH-dependent reductase (Old Yellow Enzyme family)